MRSNNHVRSPIIICRPHLWIRISIAILLLIFGLIEVWMIYRVVSAFSTFALVFVMLWGFVLVGQLIWYPATVIVYFDGLAISQWGRVRFVRWQDIDCMWEFVGYRQYILLSSGRFPKYRILAGFISLMRMKPVYGLSSSTHTNYGEVYQLLRRKLGHCYRRRITILR